MQTPFPGIDYRTVTTQTTRLSENHSAIAILTPSLQSASPFTNSLETVKAAKSRYGMGIMCDFIEDYRSSTIFDALGSVGGLLAILQGVHILLFGRPIFWGITGASSEFSCNAFFTRIYDTE